MEDIYRNKYDFEHDIVADKSTYHSRPNQRRYKLVHLGSEQSSLLRGLVGTLYR